MRTPSARAAGDLLVLFITSLTFDTTDFLTLSAKSGTALIFVRVSDGADVGTILGAAIELVAAFFSAKGAVILAGVFTILLGAFAICLVLLVALPGVLAAGLAGLIFFTVTDVFFVAAGLAAVFDVGLISFFGEALVGDFAMGLAEALAATLATGFLATLATVFAAGFAVLLATFFTVDATAAFLATGAFEAVLVLAVFFNGGLAGEFFFKDFAAVAFMFPSPSIKSCHLGAVY